MIVLASSETWGANRERTLALAEQLGIEAPDFRLDFYAGTMFWVRGDVLEPLRKLNVTLADFPAEPGKRDGELQRVFGTLPGPVGKRKEDAPQRFER